MAVNIIKYRYAYDDKQNIINITSAQPKQNYTCLSCGRKLIPKKGKKNQHHFSHESGIQTYSCSPETYLHKLAKHTFYESYTHCLQNSKTFNLTYLAPKECSACKQYGPCVIDANGRRIVDLTKHFPIIHAPDTKCDAGFRPDILLQSGNGTFLWLEIAVTHHVENPKQATGYRIIEVQIREEEDVDIIRACSLSEEDSRIRIYNISRQPVRGNFGVDCKKTIREFRLYRDGSSAIHKNTAHKYFHGHGSKAIFSEVVEDNSTASLPIHITKIEQIHLQGKLVKHCALCTSVAFSDWQGGVLFCLAGKGIKTNGNEAAKCKGYKPIREIPLGGLIKITTDRWRVFQEEKGLKIGTPVFQEGAIMITPKTKAIFSGYHRHCSGCGSLLFLEDTGRYAAGSGKLKMKTGQNLTIISAPGDSVVCPMCHSLNDFKGLDRMRIQS